MTQVTDHLTDNLQDMGAVALLVGTRKGLFRLTKVKAQWQVTAHHFPGEPVSYVLMDPRDDAWYVALNLGHFGVKLHRSQDQGAHWQEIAAPAFPLKPTEGAWGDDPLPWNVELMWCLAAGGVDEPGTLWAGCLPAGLFKSIDFGATWKLNEALWFEPKRRQWMGGGYDHPGVHSILVDPRDSKNLRLAISTGGVWLSANGGESWSLNEGGMVANFMPPESANDPNVQDAHAMLRCASAPDRLWVQHHGGIFRSDDNGKHWHEIPAPAPSGFGFALAVDPLNADRAWFVPAQSDAMRYPKDGRMLVNRTDDAGKTFRSFGTGLPQRDAYHLVYRHALAICPQGKTLAMGSTTGGLWISEDAGEQWQEISQHLPPISMVCLLTGS